MTSDNKLTWDQIAAQENFWWSRNLEVVCDKTNNTEESIAKGELHFDFIPVKAKDNVMKCLADKFEQVVKESYMKSIFGNNEAKPMNPNPLLDYVLKEDYMRLMKRVEQLEQELRVSHEETKMYKEDSRKWQRRCVDTEKRLFNRELMLEINREVVRAIPVVVAIEKMGKTPHAAWKSIVDNENEGQL